LNSQITPAGDFRNGPEFRDPRINEIDYVQYIRNKIDGEKFWVSYVSENPNLQEIRWDLFEEAMLVYLQDHIIF